MERKFTARLQRRNRGKGATTHKQSELAALERRAAEMNAKYKSHQRARAEGREPSQRDKEAMDNLYKKVQEAMQLHGIQPKLEHIDEHTLKTLTKTVAMAVAKEDREVRNARIEEARKEAERDWSKGGKFTYRKARPPPPPPTLVVSRPDGSLTAQPQEIQELVSKAWVEPIFCKHGTKPIAAQKED